VADSALSESGPDKRDRLLVDIGVNLTHPAFDADRDQALARAEAAGVGIVIITGADMASSRRAADYAAGYGWVKPGSCYATAGVHPHNAKTFGPETPALLRELAVRREVAALGECGLDYNRDYSPRDQQRRCFEAHLDLAQELGLPLFLHERDAFADFFGILKAYPEAGPRTVVHCFTGTGEALRAYLDLGCYIGVTGWLCDERRGQTLGDLLRYIPPDRLLLETDAPFLLPRDLRPRPRNGRNEPQYLAHIAAAAARLLDKAPEQLARETGENSRRLFRLPGLPEPA
jgi:TatD DNase family protein